MVNQEEMMKAEIAVERCIGAGHCASLAPDVFEQDQSDGIAVVLSDEVPSELQAAVEEAAELCPVGAILLRRRP
jgi:ferredoxin